MGDVLQQALDLLAGIGVRCEVEGYPNAIRRSVDWLNERLVRWGV